MASDWKLDSARVEDLFEAAVAIEQGGFDFYERLRSGQADARVKKELEYLRDEEAKHKELFLSFLRANPGSRSAPPAQLHALVQREFIDPLNQLFSSSRIATNEQTISFGMELERKSISFYRSLAPLVGEGRRADIERILAEEQRHLDQLGLMRAYQ